MGRRTRKQKADIFVSPTNSMLRLVGRERKGWETRRRRKGG
jgi:hypothetical protein